MDHLARIDELVPRTDGAMNLLLEYARSPDAEIRLRAVERLGSFPRSRTLLELFRRMAADPDELVRLASLEALEDHSDLESIPLLRERTNDPDWMVRGRAAIALARLGAPDATRIARDRLALGTDEEERVRYLIALFFDSPEALNELRSAYACSGYRTRCAIAHLVADAVTARYRNNREVANDVRGFLASSQRGEGRKSVKSALADALSEIDALEASAH